MISIKELLAVIHSDLSLDSPEEIKTNIELIAKVQEMNSGEREMIIATFNQGPLYDGDVPSKSARDTLVSDGFISKVIVKGEDGFNACTYKGLRAYRILMTLKSQ